MSLLVKVTINLFNRPNLKHNMLYVMLDEIKYTTITRQQAKEKSPILEKKPQFK